MAAEGAGAGGTKPAPQETEGDQIRKASGQPAVRKLTSKFDGRVVKVRKQKK